MKPFVKTSGSRGLHVYVPIVRGPTAGRRAHLHQGAGHGAGGPQPQADDGGVPQSPRDPKGRVLVDYRQNAWGQTLASIYSVRPKPKATVSTPLTWDEVEKGVRIEDFRLDNVRERIAKLGDLWKPLLAAKGRTNLDRSSSRK